MRIRLKTKAISIYLCIVTFTTVCLLLIMRFYGHEIDQKSSSFDHMAVDRVMLAHEKQRVWVPEEKPVLVIEKGYNGYNHQKANVEQVPIDQMEVDLNHDDVQKQAIEVAHMPDLSELSPTERLTSLSKAAVGNLSYADLADLYHSYVTTSQFDCHDIIRLGHVTDGGWEICGDEMFIPKKPCLVYSFGVGGDFSFDDAAARRLGCEVHSFDPSMKMNDHIRESKVHFHNKGLADFNGQANNGWQMGTLESIKHELGHENKPLSLLKVDIEEWEWQVLPEALSTESLSNINQFVIELHSTALKNLQRLDKEPTKDRYIRALRILKSLYHLGFRIFYSHKNTTCKYITRFGLKERSGCHEVHMVRVS